MDDDTFNALNKVGPAKRANYDAKLTIIQKHKPTVSAPLSIEASEAHMLSVDVILTMRDKALELAADLLRYATIQASQSYNMLTCIEETIAVQAGHKNEAAINVRNDINALKKQQKAAKGSVKSKIDAKANKIVEEKLKTKV